MCNLLCCDVNSILIFIQLFPYILLGVAIVSKARIYLTHDVDKQAEDMLAKMGYSNVVVLSESYEEIASLHGVSEVVQGGLNELTDG